MGLASKVGEAVSEGVNTLCALLEWNDGGAGEAPPIDSVTVKKNMDALKEAMREILHGGRIVGAQSTFTEEDLAHVAQLEELIVAWPSKGALSPEVVALAEACVSALWGGVSWRELMANARRT
jgi:hypothetical protein